jgi:hypothetical protein
MFGGFGGMLPIRLGGSATLGWSATQHARMASDMAAVSRSAPLASLTVLLGGTPTVESYHARNGSGLRTAPAATSLGTGKLRLVWPTVARSEVFAEGRGVKYPWVTRNVVASGHYNAAPVIASVTAISATTVDIETYKWNGAAWALSDERVSIRTFGDWIPEARIGDYDGATDKVDCSTETEPYAWLWYQEYTAMLGSAFTSVQSGLVHAKKLTLARFEAGKTRAAERSRANSVPATSDDCLGLWVEALGVPFRDSDQKWQIRQRCAAKFKGALGPTQSNVDASLAELLGSQFVTTLHQTGPNLDTPPPLTFWPAINDGPLAMDLGGGCWSSERAHISVVVVKPAPTQQADFFYQMNATLFQHLDRLLPAKCTFNWATGGALGFLLDGVAHTDGTISQLDFDALTP